MYKHLLHIEACWGERVVHVLITIHSQAIISSHCVLVYKTRQKYLKNKIMSDEKELITSLYAVCSSFF